MITRSWQLSNNLPLILHLLPAPWAWAPPSPCSTSPRPLPPQAPRGPALVCFHITPSVAFVGRPNPSTPPSPEGVQGSPFTASRSALSGVPPPPSLFQLNSAELPALSPPALENRFSWRGLGGEALGTCPSCLGSPRVVRVWALFSCSELEDRTEEIHPSEKQKGKNFLRHFY